MMAEQEQVVALAQKSHRASIGIRRGSEQKRGRDRTAGKEAPPQERVEGEVGSKLSCWDLWVIFLKAGLVFGGGLAMMALLEEELVRKRRAVSREEFLTMYALGRLVPAGTTTAVAVTYGHRFGGWVGSVVAVTALVLPATVMILLLSMAYTLLRDSL